MWLLDLTPPEESLGVALGAAALLVAVVSFSIGIRKMMKKSE
jgi:hypothetical protein